MHRPVLAALTAAVFAAWLLPAGAHAQDDPAPEAPAEPARALFDGDGAVVLNGETHKLERGDMFVIPSWIPWSLQTERQFDLFRFSDAPIMERLNFMRTMVDGQDV